MGKTLADLQSNISISADNAVTGDIEWCSGYTEFSDDIGELAGWYLALKVSPSAEGSALEGATITATYAGTVRTLEDGETFIIRLAEGEDSITFTANKEGYTEGRLTLDLSGLEKEELENTCYVSSETTGVVVDPLQFGDSKDLSGTVPFDTTTDSNHFSLKYRTFNRIPAASEIYVSFDGTQLGSSTFYTVTPLDGESYSEAIVDITITSEIIGSLVPVLSTLISPAGSDPVDSFYCSLDVSELTLEPEPTPEVNITSNTNTINVTPATYSTTKTATGILHWNATYNTIDLFSITLQGNAYVSSTRYTITAYIENDPTLVVGQATNKVLTSAFNMNCNIAAHIGTASYLTVAFSPNDLPAITIDITGLTAFDGKITPSGITYQGQTYSASDFISGGTVTRSYNNTVIDGATIKYTTVNGVSGHYLAFSVPDTKYTVTSSPIKVYSIPTTADYEALVVDTSGFPSVNLIHFLGSAPTDITINVRYPSGVGESNLAVKLKFTNCTFEAAPVPQFGVTISGFTYNNNTYSLTDILNNSSTATLTATWADNQATTDITGLDIKYNDIKGDGTFVHPIGITFENGMYNGKEITRCFTVQGASGVIDGSGYNLPYTYIVEIDNTSQNQFSLGFNDTDNTAIYLYLNIKNSTLESAST